MKVARKLLPLLASLCLVSAASSTYAEDMPPPPAGPGMMEHCLDNPEQCKAMKKRMEKRCSENPARCEKMKQRMQNMREECNKDPAACEKKRAQMHQRMEERCEKRPEACAEWKKHREQCEHGHGEAPRDHGEALQNGQDTR